MSYYGLDYVAQIGTLMMVAAIIGYCVYLHNRLFKPIIERAGMVERVKMALYDRVLSESCKEKGVDYSKIDIDFAACYKKKGSKLKDRLKEIEEDFI